MIKGSHNSATGYKLLGWQRLFTWIIQPFAQCQSKTIEEQLQEGCEVFDLQCSLKNGNWYISHGFAWYNITIDQIFDILDKQHKTCYVRLGLDNHFNNHVSIVEFYNKKKQLASRYKNVVIYMSYVEDEQIVVIDEPISVFEKYWTSTWVKSNFTGLKRLLYSMPLPKICHKKFHNEWDNEASSRLEKYYMTDFI